MTTLPYKVYNLYSSLSTEESDELISLFIKQQNVAHLIINELEWDKKLETDEWASCLGILFTEVYSKLVFSKNFSHNNKLLRHLNSFQQNSISKYFFDLIDILNIVGKFNQDMENFYYLDPLIFLIKLNKYLNIKLTKYLLQNIHKFSKNKPYKLNDMDKDNLTNKEIINFLKRKTYRIKNNSTIKSKPFDMLIETKIKEIAKVFNENELKMIYGKNYLIKIFGKTNEEKIFAKSLYKNIYIIETSNKGNSLSKAKFNYAFFDLLINFIKEDADWVTNEENETESTQRAVEIATIYNDYNHYRNRMVESLLE